MDSIVMSMITTGTFDVCLYINLMEWTENGKWLTAEGLFLLVHPSPRVVDSVGLLEENEARLFLHISVAFVMRHTDSLWKNLLKFLF